MVSGTASGLRIEPTLQKGYTALCVGRLSVLRVFAKKTPKTPRREIELAHGRAREVT